MKKRVFSKKILFWISAIFFPLLSLISIFGAIGGMNAQFNVINFLYFTALGILSLIISVKLFEKEAGTVRLMNICIVLLLLPSLYRSIISVANLNFSAVHIKYVIILIIYLILINWYRHRSAVVDEINKIGKYDG